jgi:hypothetical protein
MFIRWVIKTFFVNKNFSTSNDLNTYMDNLSDARDKKTKVKDNVERKILTLTWTILVMLRIKK